MNFEWDENTIRWYQEANVYSGFFKNIAGLIAPALKEYSTFCDVGCGLGLIDLELSHYIGSITCIDINELVIKTLIRNVEERRITNIKTKVMDCTNLEENWDIIFLSFFGSHHLENYLPRCKKLISVVAKGKHPEFYPEKYKKTQKSTVEDVEQILRLKGISYSLKEASFEFGQPLRSREEARSFVRTQASNISEEDLTEFLSQRLLETGQDQYPFFIPRMKSMGIFEIKGWL
ncbi:MAG TPA: class I SAM-dependent methyltransferase [Syntrophomonadaceae bacterium]|nr:class I SAM-dependent methyltransferase [Syntrophomonadaceae bacterium]